MTWCQTYNASNKLSRNYSYVRCEKVLEKEGKEKEKKQCVIFLNKVCSQFANKRVGSGHLDCRGQLEQWALARRSRTRRYRADSQPHQPGPALGRRYRPDRAPVLPSLPLQTHVFKLILEWSKDRFTALDDKLQNWFACIGYQMEALIFSVENKQLDTFDQCQHCVTRFFFLAISQCLASKMHTVNESQTFF